MNTIIVFNTNINSYPIIIITSTIIVLIINLVIMITIDASHFYYYYNSIYIFAYRLDQCTDHHYYYITMITAVVFVSVDITKFLV